MGAPALGPVGSRRDGGVVEPLLELGGAGLEAGGAPARRAQQLARALVDGGRLGRVVKAAQ